MDGKMFFGGLFIIGAVIQFYRVFFDKKADSYWENKFLGGGFKTGCIYPALLIFIGYALITNSGNQVTKVNETKTESPITQNIPSEPIIENKEFKYYVGYPIEKIKKYIQENQKKLEDEKNRKEFLLELDNGIKSITKEIDIHTNRKTELLEIKNYVLKTFVPNDIQKPIQTKPTPAKPAQQKSLPNQPSTRPASSNAKK